MNLRHIYPRSSDWMDAMLEGEPESKRRPGAEKAQGDEGQTLLAASGEDGASASAPPGGPA